MAGLLREINEQIQSFQAELRDLSDYVWEHPELAFQEHLACARQRELLERHGCQVTTPAFDVETAYATEYSNGDGRSVGVEHPEWEHFPTGAAFSAITVYSP